MRQARGHARRTEWNQQEEHDMYTKILVPTDGSGMSNQAVTAAIAFARACGASIVALSVVEPYSLVGTEGPMTLDLNAEMNQLQLAARQNVDRVAQQAQAAGLACDTVTSYSAMPHDEIIQVAQQKQCDLIFMASHGKRGMGRLVTGSVTQNVLAHSTIPVLVLRPQVVHRSAATPAPASP
jgi:nucleotide-binding universal stress UspA family protein